jgi:hypothetical protein
VQAWRCTREDLVERLLYLLEAWPETGTAGTSWCGGAEAGLVRAAPLRKEGVKARRKRKAAEIEPDPSAGTASSTARWVSPDARRQELRCALHGVFSPARMQANIPSTFCCL